MGVDVVLDGQLAGGNHTLGLVADVEEDLVAVNLDDGAFDDVAVVEVLDGGIDSGEEFIGIADVIDGYLGCDGLGGHADSDTDRCRPVHGRVRDRRGARVNRGPRGTSRGHSVWDTCGLGVPREDSAGPLKAH